MTYATRTDLEARYAQDVAQRETVLPVLGVDNALADADAEIDSYLGVRYSVPVSPVSARILQIACVIARYRLLGDAATDVARRDYEDARAYLRDIAAGRAQLEGAAALSTSPTSRLVEIATVPTVFGRSGGDNEFDA
jgi:phage gp36-like protein